MLYLYYEINQYHLLFLDLFSEVLYFVEFIVFYKVNKLYFLKYVFGTYGLK